MSKLSPNSNDLCDKWATNTTKVRQDNVLGQRLAAVLRARLDNFDPGFIKRTVLGSSSEMVYYFTSNVVSPPASIYVGKDKFENEELIKYGLEQDVWYSKLTLIPFISHLQALTHSRWMLPGFMSIISLVRNKKDNITVIYTPWSNLMKNASMATGQVSFHNPKLTRKIFVPARENAIINRLNKTRVERFPDLMAEKEEYLKKKRKEERRIRDEKRAQEKREKKEREELKWQKEHAYDDLMSEENVQQSSNQDRDPNFLDDFM
ncbi:hypothetical protein VTN00DRAFT_4546 [Thermoascus crustaceus]|uniref:uncharacterized protein n=1 Tax=Thermoascus crustaceus TaxID=5088 RepID=UPI00374242E5